MSANYQAGIQPLPKLSYSNETDLITLFTKITILQSKYTYNSIWNSRFSLASTTSN